MSDQIRIMTDVPGDQISGKVPFVAPEGLGVVYNGTDPSSLEKATNVPRAYLLRRPVVESIGLEYPVFVPTFLTPVKQGLEATARRVRWAEVEGAGLIWDSGTGALDANTAVDTALEYLDGRLRERQGTNHIAGYVRALMDPVDAANAKRYMVEFVD